MRVILKVLSRTGKGQRVWLSEGQEVRVGRTEWAEVALPRDGCLSTVHFALALREGACYIQDLNSSNGTFVNRRRISERTQLADGDKIFAGHTRFVVRFREVGADLAVREDVSLSTEAPRPFVPLEADLGAGRVNACYTVETCATGLARCRGLIAELHPADLAARLAVTYPLYFIAHFPKLGQGLPEGFPRPCYLFDWLPPEPASYVSPVVFSQKEWAAWAELVRAGWGKDGLICLFSRQGPPELLKHLRQALHGNGSAEGMLGCCWPGVLSLLLATGSSRQAEQLLSGIDAVLVECSARPESWQLYGRKQLAADLRRLGLHPKGEACAADARREGV